MSAVGSADALGARKRAACSAGLDVNAVAAAVRAGNCARRRLSKDGSEPAAAPVARRALTASASIATERAASRCAGEGSARLVETASALKKPPPAASRKTVAKLPARWLNKKRKKRKQAKRKECYGDKDEVNGNDGGRLEDENCASKVGRQQVFSTRDVRPLDIICSRGRPYHKHPGNIRFLAIVDAYRDEYDAASRRDKVSIAARVVAVVRSSEFGGYSGDRVADDNDDDRLDSAPSAPSSSLVSSSPVRFLRRVGRSAEEEEEEEEDAGNGGNGNGDAGDVWVEVSQDIAVDKASHALRSKYRTVRYTFDDVRAAIASPSKHNKPETTLNADTNTNTNTNSNGKSTRNLSSSANRASDAANASPSASTDEVTNPTTSIIQGTGDSSLIRSNASASQPLRHVVASIPNGPTTTVDSSALWGLQADILPATFSIGRPFDIAEQIIRENVLAERHKLAVLEAAQRRDALLDAHLAAGLSSSLLFPTATLVLAQTPVNIQRMPSLGLESLMPMASNGLPQSSLAEPPSFAPLGVFSRHSTLYGIETPTMLHHERQANGDMLRQGPIGGSANVGGGGGDIHGILGGYYGGNRLM